MIQVASSQKSIQTKVEQRLLLTVDVMKRLPSSWNRGMTSLGEIQVHVIARLFAFRTVISNHLDYLLELVFS